jgi:epoxyqueuosine reductase
VHSHVVNGPEVDPMDAATLWRDIVDELEAQGIKACVLPVERLDDARRRVDEAIAGAEFPEVVAANLADDLSTPLPEGEWRSLVIAAVGRPLTQANLTWRGETRTIVVPPHYAGYAAVPRAMAARVDELLRPAGFRAAHCEPPLKTLATGAGLARYGRNNVTYVPGLGSWLQLGACVSDAPPPEGAEWGDPQVLDRCERCSACLRACPTQAIGGERFVLHTERCLTFHNESRDPLPEWIDPGAHHTAVGCLRCQQACPENVRVELVQAAPEWFDEEETAAILAAEHLAADASADSVGEAAAEQWPGVADATREKLARCGLDYSPKVIARNIRVLLEGQPRRNG